MASKNVLDPMLQIAMLQIEKKGLKNNFISFGKISIYPFAFNNSRSEHEVKQVFFNTFMV